MVEIFHLATVLTLSVSMALSLAHALELPGKLRLDEDAYTSVQTIYYPGFTYGGFVGEIGGLIALPILAYLLPWASSGMWLIVIALLFHLAGHLTYWLMTHPVNGFWLQDVEMAPIGNRFFGFLASGTVSDWKTCRTVWEASHVIRSVLFALSFGLATAALVVTPCHHRCCDEASQLEPGRGETSFGRD